MTDLREINALIDRIRDAGLRSKRHALAHELRHAVSALDAAEGRVTVRPLVWVELEQDRGDGTTDLTGNHEAETVVGTYQIELGFGSDSFYWSVARDGEEIRHSLEDLDYAKNAAQADYEARILSAIALTTPSDKIAEAALTVDDLAAILWREQAVAVGAPDSVANGRTADAFAEQSDEIMATFRKYARAALRALAGKGE